MSRFTRFRSVLALVVLLLSGCLGATDGPAAPADPASAPLIKGTGRILGTVLDEELRPVANASATLQHLHLRTWTSDEGKFVLQNVGPGNHSIYLNKTGYNDTVIRVEVAPDGVAAPKATMQSLRPSDPFSHSTVKSGRIIHRYGALCSEFNMSWVSGGDTTQFNQTTGARLATVLTAIVWTPVSPTAPSKLEARVVSGAEPATTTTVSGPSPLLGRLDLEKPLQVRPSYLTHTVRLPTCGDRVQANWEDQDFRVHTTFWYNGPAPPDATALPK